MQTREQIYATGVYELVSRVSTSDKQKYGSMAHKLPILIRSAGLAQALAFVATRTKAEKQLLQDLATVLKKDTAEQLLKASRNDSISEYMLLTEHALAALLWFKRYAQSVLEVDAAIADNIAGEADDD